MKTPHIGKVINNAKYITSIIIAIINGIIAIETNINA